MHLPPSYDLHYSSRDSQLYQGWFSYLRHELRTPVNAILGYSEMILEECEDLGEHTHLETLQDVHQLGKRVLAQINHLLAMDNLSLDQIETKARQLSHRLRLELHPPLHSLVYLVEILLEEPQLQPFVDDLDRILYASRDLLSRTQSIVDISDLPIAEQLEQQQWLDTHWINSKSVSLTDSTESLATVSGRILVVDDNEQNCDLLVRKLGKEGYDVDVAFNGEEALSMLGRSSYDLVLLDIRMPYMSGHEVLYHMKRHQYWRHIPVIMISATDELEDAVSCIEHGAVDCLSKPFNSVLLRARIEACLENKRLHDQQNLYVSKLAKANKEITSLNDRLQLDNIRLQELNDQLNEEISRRQQIEEDLRCEKAKSEELLLNILPELIAEQLKKRPGAIANRFDDVTILFADIANFTELADNVSAIELVNVLNQIFSCFDRLTESYGLEKIKTIGDSYLVVGGLPIPRADHAHAIADLALAMQREIQKFKRWDGLPFEMRIGINTGQVVAGVIGLRKFIYDLWGDAVNVASRMESQGIPGKIQVTESTYDRLRYRYRFSQRGIISVKGKGEMQTYFLEERLDRYLDLDLEHTAD